MGKAEREFHRMSAVLTLVRHTPPDLATESPELHELVVRRRDAIEKMVADMDQVLREIIGPPVPGMVLGVSVYQYLLLHSLGLARQLRDLYPDATILLGGDPLDIITGSTLLEANTWLDGLVVGPGEYALNEIVATLKEGASVRDANIVRLLNHEFLRRPTESADEWNRVLWRPVPTTTR
jgi:hypothetical protein